MKTGGMSITGRISAESDFIWWTSRCSRREEGFPLDPISVDVDNGKYFTQLEGQQSIFEKE